jgi:hypothetical protein
LQISSSMAAENLQVRLADGHDACDMLPYRFTE